MKAALLVVDMLEEFVRGRLRSPQAEGIVPAIRALAEAARRCGAPVIHVVDSHLPSDRELKVWGPHAMRGSPEAKIVGELGPSPGDIVLPKRFYSGFRETGLDSVLRDLGVGAVVVTGIHTHICVLHTVADAFFLGYDIYVVRDAVAAFSAEDHEWALKYMEKVYGAKVVSAKEAEGIVCGREPLVR